MNVLPRAAARALFALAISMPLALAACSSAPSGEPTGTSTSEALVLGEAQAMAFAHQAGIPCDGLDGNLVMAGAIAAAESGLDTSALGFNGPTPGCPNGSRDRGLWQINDCYHPDVSDACAYDGACNARAMFEVSSGGRMWSPWSTYENGAFRAHLDAARAAYDAVCGVGSDGCTAEERADAAHFGCQCVDHKASGGFCSGTGCTAEETSNAAHFGCSCVDHKASGSYCDGSGCTAKETEDAAKFGCQCVDHKASGGFCDGSGCTAKETADAAKFGCGCVDHKGAGGFCAGSGCTARETNACKAQGKSCALHACK